MASNNTAASANEQADVPVAIPDTYARILPADGAAFLFSATFAESLKREAVKLSKICDVSPKDAIEEFRRLLALKVFTVDTDANKISPSAIMDVIWHGAVLDTRFYAKLCSALGMFLHHDPAGADEDQEIHRELRLNNMVSLYMNIFGDVPLNNRPADVLATAPCGQRCQQSIMFQYID